MKKQKKLPQCGNKQTKRVQPHFRKFRNAKLTGHPQYVYDEEGRIYKIIGITSSPRTNGIDNIPLERNPSPKNSAKAYIRPKPDSVDKGVENVRLKGWSFSEKDKKKAQTIIDSHDKKKK